MFSPTSRKPSRSWLAQLAPMLPPSCCFSMLWPASRSAKRSIQRRTPLSIPSARARCASSKSQVWLTWRNLDYTVRTGRPALEVSWGMHTTIWSYLDQNPLERKTFQRALAANASLILPAVLASYDFSAIRYLVDVGGGQGSLCLALLSRYPDLQATLFERPGVIAQAQTRVRTLPAPLAARYHLVDGDFFAAVPAGAECYVLKNVLMDWRDAAALEILKRCRQAMDPQRGRLLVIEPVLGPDTPFTRFFSLQMAMLMHAARHRSLEEHRALFAQAGFELCYTTSLGLEQMLLEGRPVESTSGGDAA